MEEQGHSTRREVVSRIREQTFSFKDAGWVSSGHDHSYQPGLPGLPHGLGVAGIPRTDIVSAVYECNIGMIPVSQQRSVFVSEI